MADPIKKPGFGDAKVAQKILDDYVDGYDGLSVEECASHGLPPDSAMRVYLQEALEQRNFEFLEMQGFSKGFSEYISGPAGASAFKKRILWIADNVTVRRRWLFFPVGDYERGELLGELRNYGPAANGARDALVRVIRESIDDNNSYLGHHAVFALERIGPGAEDASTIARFIEKESFGLGTSECSAVRMLFAFDPSESRPALMHALKIDHDICRDDLIPALARLGRGVVPELVGIIASGKTDSASRGARTTAIAALAKLGPELHDEIRKYADQLVTPLIVELLDAYMVERTKVGPVARLLKIIGRAAIPALMTAFDRSFWKGGSNPNVGYEVILGGKKYFTRSSYAFEEICHDILSSMPEASLQAMIDLVNGDDEDKRRMAYEVLEKMGESAAPALPALIARLDGDTINFSRLRPVIIAIGAPAVRPLREKLYFEDNRVKRNALDALGRIGKKANSAVPDCVPFLKDPDAQLRRTAALVLGEISTGEPHVVMNLVHTLSDPEQWVRALAVSSLKLITPGSGLEQIVVPALEHMRDNSQESADNRKTAEEAIQEILKKIS